MFCAKVVDFFYKNTLFSCAELALCSSSLPAFPGAAGALRGRPILKGSNWLYPSVLSLYTLRIKSAQIGNAVEAPCPSAVEVK